MIEHRKEIEELIRDILKEKYLELKIESYVFEEDLAAGTGKIRASVVPVIAASPDAPRKIVEGKGVGIVDAFFRGLAEQFSPDYPSLRTIRFIGFTVKGMLDKDRPRGMAGSDAVGEVRLVVENSEGDDFGFVSTSKSITASALQATLEAVEYFVNSEAAFIATHRAVKDAQARGRNDLAQQFGRKLAELVKNTSYSEVIEAAKNAR